MPVVGAVLGQYWDSAGTVLGQYWDSTGTVLGQYWGSTGAVLCPILMHYWESTVPVLGQYCGNTGEVVSKCWGQVLGPSTGVSAGSVLWQYWGSTGTVLGKHWDQWRHSQQNHTTQPMHMTQMTPNTPDPCHKHICKKWKHPQNALIWQLPRAARAGVFFF